jgi:hypothetical protein
MAYVSVDVVIAHDLGFVRRVLMGFVVHAKFLRPQNYCDSVLSLELTFCL